MESVQLNQAVSGSATVAELRRLRPRLRNAVGISDTVLQLLDIAVKLVRVLVSSSDSRPAIERFKAAIEGVSMPDINKSEIEAFQARPEQPGYVDSTIRRWTKISSRTRKFLAKSAGAATAHRLNEAINADSKLLFEGLAKGVNNMLPIAQAIDSCGEFSSSASTKALFGGQNADGTAGEILPMVTAGVRLGEFLEMLGDLRIEEIFTDDMGSRLSELLERKEPTNIGSTTEQLLEVITSDTRERLNNLSDRLGRKIQGARDVLDISADGSSQAANSLVEFVDHLLRATASDADVLSWLEGRDVAEATYTKDGKTLPTKRGQAFHFITGGRDSVKLGDDAMTNYLVDGIIGVRKKLQIIKHADTGDAEERDTIRRAAYAIEGFVTYSLKVGWVSRSDADLDALRSRLM